MQFAWKHINGKAKRGIPQNQKVYGLSVPQQGKLDMVYLEVVYGSKSK
jgi:hypothetical protein